MAKVTRTRLVSVSDGASKVSVEQLYVSYKMSIGDLLMSEIGKSGKFSQYNKSIDSPTSMYIRIGARKVYIVWAAEDWISVDGTRCYTIRGVLDELSRVLSGISPGIS